MPRSRTLPKAEKETVGRKRLVLRRAGRGEPKPKRKKKKKKEERQKKKEKRITKTVWGSPDQHFREDPKPTPATKFF